MCGLLSDKWHLQPSVLTPNFPGRSSDTFSVKSVRVSEVAKVGSTRDGGQARKVCRSQIHSVAVDTQLCQQGTDMDVKVATSV